MNHSKVVYITNRTTLDLGHRKFAVRYCSRYTPRLRLGVYLLQTSSDLGLGSIYTSLVWFMYNMMENGAFLARKDIF